MFNKLLNYFKLNPNGSTGYKVFKVIWTTFFAVPYLVVAILYIGTKIFSKSVDIANEIIIAIPLVRLVWTIVVTVIYLVEALVNLALILLFLICNVPDFLAPQEGRPKYIFEDNEKVREE